MSELEEEFPHLTSTKVGTSGAVLVFSTIVAVLMIGLFSTLAILNMSMQDAVASARLITLVYIAVTI